MPSPFVLAIEALWFVWLISWAFAARWRRAPSAQAPRRDYRWHMALVAFGFVLLFWVRPGGETVLWPVSAPLGWAAIALAAAGCAFAWWARIHLGALWSGGIEAKEGHHVIDSGPYALVRHPIYTGLIVAALALASVRATPGGVEGFGLMALGFTLKARVEERFLEAEIGGYEDYKRRVPMLVPLPWRRA